MNTKRFLFVAVVVAMLGTIISLPVLAEDPTAMWVSRVRLAYNGRGSRGPDRVIAMVHVRDSNLASVEGATVTGEWTLPDGTELLASGETDFQGIASFEVWAGSGEYEFCVTGVTKGDGGDWTYDPDSNAETCGVLVIKWPYSPPSD